MTQKDFTAKGLTLQLPSLIGTQEFTPSGLMIKMLCAHLQSIELEKPQSVIQLLTMDGHSRSNWYDWLKKKGFVEWWNKACTDFHTHIGLSKVHMGIYRRAVSSSPQDAKTYLERFDKDYKPATSQDHNFPGLEPPKDIPAAIERSKQRAKQVASEVVEGSPEPVQDGRTPTTDGDDGGAKTVDSDGQKQDEGKI